MAEYSKEFSQMKGKARKDLKDLIAGIKSGAIQMRGNEPKMSYRALRTLVLSEDKVHGDLVEQYLSGKLNVEQFKNKLRSSSEVKIPNRYRLLPTDRIHHGTPLEVANIVEDMPDDELRNMLIEFGEEGYTFGDTEGNVKGGSFDERAHTGARPKASKSKQVFPNTEGEAGLREVSAHPRGTNDPFYKNRPKIMTAAQARQELRPVIQQSQADLALGVQADTGRRAAANQLLIDNDIISKGSDVFSKDATPEMIQKAQQFFKKNNPAQKLVAQAFKTPANRALLGPVLGTAGLVMDAGGAKASLATLADPKATKIEKGQAKVDALASGLGIASFFNPALTPAAVGTGLASLAIQNRRDRDKEKEKELQLLTGERSYVGPAETLQIRPSATERAKLTSQLRNRRRGTAFR